MKNQGIMNLNPKGSSPTATVSVRLPEALATDMRKAAKALNQSPTDFVKLSIKNEISRRALCRPERTITLADLKAQINQVNEQLARREANERRILATLEVIAVAMGVSQ